MIGAALIGAGITLVAVRVAWALLIHRGSVRRTDDGLIVRPRMTRALTVGALGGAALVAAGVGLAPLGFSTRDSLGPPLSREERAKIVAEIDELSRSCRVRRDELQTSRLVALAAIPAAKAALDQHHAEVLNAQRTLANDLRTAAENLEDAERAASRALSDADEKLERDVRAVDPDAARTRARAEADRVYGARLREINASPSPLENRQVERRKAQAARDAAYATADADAQRIREEANARWTSEYIANREKQVADVQAARRRAEDTRERAERTWRNAMENANATLTAALRRIPEAEKVDADAARWRTELDAGCESAIAAAQSRLRRA